MAYTADLSNQLDELESHGAKVDALMAQRGDAVATEQRLAAEIEQIRKEAAVPLARAIESELAHLSMANATVEISVDGPAGDSVAILLAPNPGLPLLPVCLLYTSPSPRDQRGSRMPSSA